ncbi:hypothetical protein SPRG_01090 [Saprolegnia parasitica CBS 223.65]|uniref:Glycoside hydrolase family 5 domain-containing protein n=1 Tax=Saprolegnia parasitica (strain CBS 223.65) TaxID=695850 RepID=A0A067D8P6_SAPPC|nr:hypothetical protein SPRG_01090 [Saprolegnia parasitica CBS 223.65]KDO35026.1 hypothetical protein SPRG_01090 [Saprolegnia parasitica CBS 223.65]|eukprot:XP_012194679.1 hypothetical protein SPRG_01090 [Saprolegnia parasitica CBS 223.65]
MATSPRATSPRGHQGEEEDDDMYAGRRPSSPASYKRYESGAIDDDDVAPGHPDDANPIQGELQQMPGPRPRKKTATEEGRPSCGMMWRRRCIFLVLFAGCAAVVAYFVIKLVAQKSSDSSAGNGATTVPVAPTGAIQDGVGASVDPAVGSNPTKYPSPKCKQPNYVSSNGKIYIVGTDGTNRPVSIKGINWSGMETGNAIPYGLWANGQNGTTVYEVASFLARNNFNSVRLPLSIESILQNRVPNKELLNVFSNKAIDPSTYLSLLSSLVKAFAYRGISVLLDLHVLTVSDIGPKWTSDQISQASYLSAVDTLTKTLCNDAHWNVLGIDLKNEPSQMTWGDKTSADWRVAATLIGNQMLQGCPNWLAFVEGVNDLHTMTLPTGVYTSYYDWWGAGLQNAGDYPITLTTDNKIVYAPHYYSPSVYPQMYLLKDGTQVGDLIGYYTELDNATLKSVVLATANNMFGYLTTGPQKATIVLGEFGGLYTQDRHANYTVRRVIESCMDMVKQPGFAGGYVWSLNPESAYNYNPSDHKGVWQEGLVALDWVTVNKPYLNALKQMDSMADLIKFPCIS